MGWTGGELCDSLGAHKRLRAREDEYGHPRQPLECRHPEQNSVHRLQGAQYGSEDRRLAEWNGGHVRQVEKADDLDLVEMAARAFDFAAAEDMLRFPGRPQV